MATATKDEKKLEIPPVAAKEPVGEFPESEHSKKLRDDAQVAVERMSHKDEKFIERLDRRHAVRDPEAVATAADVRKHEAERLTDQERAANEAAERAAKWIGEERYEGRLDHVEIRLHPEEKARKMTIQIRAIGEVEDGFVMIFEDPIDPLDMKQGRVAESPRFGTKNRVRVAEVDPKTGEATGEYTIPGYFDFGPLRMTPGKYHAVVVDMDDKILADETFEIAEDTTGDGRSDQVKTKKDFKAAEAEGKDPGQSEEERAADQAQMLAHQQAKAEGTPEDAPAPEPSEGVAGPSPAEKKARKESPEGRAK